MIIIHGKNVVKSRRKLLELIALAKKNQQRVERVEARLLSRADLETQLTKTDLFGNQHLVVIEGLHSLPRSGKKQQLIELVTKSQVDVILWEKRELTKTMLGKFPQASIHRFKLSSALFAWLDTLRGDGRQLKKQLIAFHQVLEAEDPYLCLVMLARQIRMLIPVAAGEKATGSPWMIKKLQRQAQTFNLNQLLNLYHRLLKLDQSHKTSSHHLKLDQELDLLLVTM